ncbi:CPBP family glutamic-type intramembrane protease [Propionibacteriaceae bacterium Y2011]
MSTSLTAWTEPLPARTWVAWRPGRDTWLALVSVVAMWASYYGQGVVGESNSLAGFAMFIVLIMIVLGTLVPVVVVIRLMRRPLADIGLTLRRWWLALVISLIVGGGSIPALWSAAGEAGLDPLPHMVANMLMVWEPMFVYGWLQLRFRDAFGELPAPILAALGFGAYHLGSVDLPTVLFFTAFGLVFAIAFAFTRNLLSLAPLTWAVTSGIGTISAGVTFGWSEAAILVVPALLQVVIVVIAWRTRPRAVPG